LVESSRLNRARRGRRCAPRDISFYMHGTVPPPQFGCQGATTLQGAILFTLPYHLALFTQCLRPTEQTFSPKQPSFVPLLSNLAPPGPTGTQIRHRQTLLSLPLPLNLNQPHDRALSQNLQRLRDSLSATVLGRLRLGFESPRMPDETPRVFTIKVTSSRHS
jgi:hypothetical protein